MLVLIGSCALTGCHSLRFGKLFLDREKESRLALRAALGGPIPPAARTQPQPFASDVRDDRSTVIDLATALRRAGVANPMVAFAEEAVQIRLAEQMQARALLFPTLNAGANVRFHQGNLLTTRGLILDNQLQSVYWGFGAGARGTGSVAVPGLSLVSHLADAIYAPQAARAKVVQSRSDASAARQSILLEVGVGYLALAGVQARLVAYGESLGDFSEIEQLTANFAKTGQGRDSDAQRARAEALLLRAEARRAEEALGVAAADLARLLDLDPSAALRAADRTPPILEMVDRKIPLQALLDQTIAVHPEIVARAAEVSVQQIRLRQERARPWLPLIAVGFSTGGFGGSGSNTTSRVGDFLDRTDLDVAAIWSVQGLGLGNRAVQNVARTGVEMAQLDLARTVDLVRQRVVEAHALSQARLQEMELARQRGTISLRAFQQELNRVKNVQGRPLEVLVSANQLAAARQDLVRAMVAYSQAQLQLFVALGNEP